MIFDQSKFILLISVGRIVALCKNLQTKYKTIYKHFCGIQMPNIIYLYKIPFAVEFTKEGNV